MIEQIVQDAWGSLSSRRIAGFGALVLAGLCAGGAYLGHDLAHYFDGLLTFASVAFGLATADHFAPTAHKEEAPNAPAP